MTDRIKKRPAPPQLDLPEWKVPDCCAGCSENDTLSIKEIAGEMLIHGVKTTYKAKKYSCSACDFAFESPDQATQNTKVARQVYQIQHSLLSAEEITSQRNALGLSQSQLAKLAGIGIASLKRWESGKAIQTAENDKKLRTVFSTQQESKAYKQEVYRPTTTSLGWAEITYNPVLYVKEAFAEPPEENAHFGISDKSLCAQ